MQTRPLLPKIRGQGSGLFPGVASGSSRCVARLAKGRTRTTYEVRCLFLNTEWKAKRKRKEKNGTAEQEWQAPHARWLRIMCRGAETRCGESPGRLGVLGNTTCILRVGRETGSINVGKTRPRGKQGEDRWGFRRERGGRRRDEERQRKRGKKRCRRRGSG